MGLNTPVMKMIRTAAVTALTCVNNGRDHYTVAVWTIFGFV
jgi:hypothetical protein